MNDDIVTRLREFIRMGIAVGPFHAEQAADEIERLRIDRDRWRKIATNLINGAEQQIDAFREPWDKSTNEAWLGAWHDYHQAVTDEQG